jgi:hypothetical protein
MNNTRTRIETGRKRLRWTLWSLVLLLLITIGLCILLYPEPYEFFGQTISSLGEVTSKSGLSNATSQWIFTTGFALLAIGVLVMLTWYFKFAGLYMSWLKGLILVMFFVGTIGTAFPADHSKYAFLHIVGCALFVFAFGLYNFVSQLLRFIRKHVPKPKKRIWDFYLDTTFVILVFLAVVWYLLSGLFIDILGKNASWIRAIFHVPISQKVLLIVCCIAAFLLDLDDM